MSITTQQQASSSISHADLMAERRRIAVLHAQALDAARHDALANSVNSFLPVVDALLALKATASLGRGLPSKRKLRHLKEGVVGVSDLSIQTLQKMGVTLIRPNVGDLFRPDLHEAIAIHGTQPSENKKDGSQSTMDLAIAKVIEAGYNLNGQVLRPACVEVTSYEK
ncbi:Mge1 [Giardia muris]|uniref:Mge1 n=1 Tax=Giardia muris TaxID=5742 RepID=A0A4Z1TAC3_GIAMU|nr:Mge1 [Giardia muris]|eukprot:TNJ30177.1 Mge1 [Giardia muris]